jgi:hypothetical protein
VIADTGNHQIAEQTDDDLGYFPCEPFPFCLIDL